MARARAVLDQLETTGEADARLDDLPLFAMAEPAAPAPVAPLPLIEALGALEPDDLSPREALDALYRLKALSRGSGPGTR